MQCWNHSIFSYGGVGLMDVTSLFKLFQLGVKFHGLSVFPPAASDEVQCWCLREGTGDMKAGLVLVVMPNSTACRAVDVFGKMHRDLWPSACSLPPAAAQRLLFAWGGR